LKESAGSDDIVLGDQNAAGQDSERAFHHAHVLVEDQRLDAGLAQHRFDEGNSHQVIGPQELFHRPILARGLPLSSARLRGRAAADNRHGRPPPFPNIPFHHTPEAHRRIMSALPPDSPYHAAEATSFFAELARFIIRRPEPAAGLDRAPAE
jgi:hypothetical protein